MLNKPNVQVYLKGDKEYAKTFLPQAFKVYEQYLRDRDRTANRLEIDKLQPRLSDDSEVVIRIHHNQAEIHILAQRPPLEEEREPSKKKVPLHVEKPNFKLLLRVYVHVDVIHLLATSDSNDYAFPVRRDQITSGIAAATWDTETMAFTDIQSGTVPLLSFFSWSNNNRSPNRNNRPGRWEGVCSGISKYQDEIVNYYEQIVPSSYGAGVATPGQRDLQAFIVEPDCKVFVPAAYPAPGGVDVYLQSELNSNIPWEPAGWVDDSSNNPTTLNFDTAGGCSASHQMYYYHDTTGDPPVQVKTFHTYVRRAINMNDGLRQCSDVYHRWYRNTTSELEYRNDGYKSPIFGEMLNGCSTYKTSDSVPYRFGYYTPLVTAMLDGMPVIDKDTVYAVPPDYDGPRVNPEQEWTATYPVLGDSIDQYGPWAKMFGFNTSRTLDTGFQWHGDLVAGNVRQASTADDFTLRGLVNLHLAAGKGLDIFNIEDTGPHTLATAQLVQLYKTAVRAGGGFISDPTTLTSDINAYRTSSYGFTDTFDIRSQAGAVYGSPIFGLKIYIAPVLVQDDPSVIVSQEIEYDEYT